MASLYVTFLILVICLITWSRGCEDVPEFQFPCYVDVCTFPRQFCNSDQHERRCSPCSRSICRGDRIPVACKYICMKYNKPDTPTPVPPTTKIPQSSASQNKGNEDLTSVYLILAYSAVVCTLLAIVILIFIGYYVLRKKQKLDKRKTFKSNAIRSRMDANEVMTQLLEGEEKRHQNISLQCVKCQHQMRPVNDMQSPPPSYHTNGPSTIATNHSGERSLSESGNSILDRHMLSTSAGPTTTTISAQTEETFPSTSRLINRYRTNATADGEGEYHEKAWSMGYTPTCANDTAIGDRVNCSNDVDEETSLKNVD